MKEKNNKLIAEFMGKEIYQNYHESFYHTSWDWLMPVVNKCKSFSLDNTYADRIDEALVESEIDFDYLFCAVLDFIEWYNNENKTTKTK